MVKFKTTTLDLEPRWVDMIYNLAEMAVNGKTTEARELGRKELMKVATLADKVRQAQKAGKKSIKI